MTKTRYALMSLAVVLTVLFQLAMPVIVRADDTTPPTDQPTEVATDPGTGTPDGSTPTEVATPVPTTDATATDAVATAVPASADDPAPATEVAPLMSQVPDGTDVVVLNPDGSAASLATQAAADAIATSDPIWCPAGQSPTTDTDAVTAGIQNGCTAPYSNFTSLLGDTSISGDGTIYVEAGIYAGSETSVQFDGSVLTGWGALTLQGGWDLDSSSGTYDSLVGTSDFSIPITVTNWGSAVSLYDLTVSGAGIQVDNSASTSAAPVVLSAVDQSGNTSGDGVAVISNGNVSLTNVTATDNSGNGAAVDTTSGTGNVAVTGGAYSNNGAAGLKVNSGGSVSLNNVPEVQTVTVPPACGETYTDLGFQLVFQDATASTLLADTSTASDIQTALNTLTTVTVSGPDGGPWQVIFGTTGIMEPVQAVRECVDSSSVSQDPAPSSLATVDTWGTVVAQGNTGDGLNINGNGDVTVEGAYLNDNSGWGMKVTSTGSIFVGGGGYSGVVAGLDYSQFVELDPIPLVPMGNTLGGASLNAGGDIWVGQSLFAYSGDCPGIEAYANGDITLIDVIGAGNIGEGAILNNAAGSGDVEVDGSYFFDNGSTGLDVYSSGDITLNTVFATGLNFEFLPIGLSLTDGFSQQDGIYIDNSYGMGDINVTTAILAGNTWTGLTAYSNGDIELDGVLAMGNGTGAILDNTTGDGSIVVNDSGFLGNAWTGLDAYSNGDINLTDVAALGMGILASSAVSTPSTPPAPLITQEYGAYLDTSSGTGSIYISASDFSENAYGGLTAQTSTGDISLVDVTATMNGYQETPVLDEEGNPVLDEFGNPEFQVVADDGSYGVGLASSGGGTISVAGTMTLSGSVPDGSSSYFS
ncbi:MAG TPA: right-handed parallel beta-helix repeat-containing protein, partial [Anaerolineales bacterium]|nr:right-handed parallel beta-helix repeat-containing protein [Anaerolineales bacterium]